MKFMVHIPSIGQIFCVEVYSEEFYASSHIRIKITPEIFFPY